MMFAENERKGDLYEETKDLSPKEIAALIRKYVRETYKGVIKASVRTQHYDAIQVSITDYRGGQNPQNPGYNWTNGTRGDRFVPEVWEIIKDIEKYANRFQRDRSEIQFDYFDVRFYLSVDIDWKYAGKFN
jgi:hypothetical protein